MLNLDPYGRYCPVCRREKLNYRQKTCSPKCRKAYQRQRENLHRSVGIIMAELISIGDTLKRREDLKDMANQLLRDIETRVRDTLKLRPDDDMKALQSMLYDRERRKV